MIAPSFRSLKEAFESGYLDYAPDISPKTEAKMRYELVRWERCFGDSSMEITTAHFAKFRRFGLDQGLSPDSIETNIGTILTILRAAETIGAIDSVPSVGRRLKRRRNQPRFLSLEELGRMYDRASVADWPRLHVRPGTFWRCWIVFCFFTGLRLEDQMLRVYWRNVKSDRVIVEAGKTEKLHVFPMHPVLSDHLELMRIRKDRVFPIGKSPKQLRRELRRICEAAQIEPHVTPQHLRQTAGTHWEMAKDGAGQKLLGHSLGVSDRYIHVPAILKEAVEYLVIPRQFYLRNINDLQKTLF